jgi:antitoxin component of RelBE/YafQ-DinJ toxin-antitoxin module
MMVKVTKEIHAKLKQMSKELNMPMSQCINMLVTQWLKDNK